MKLTLEPEAIDCAIIPVSRNDGHIDFSASQRLTPPMAQTLIDKIQEYTNFLASHPPLKPKKFLESYKERNLHLRQEYRKILGRFHHNFHIQDMEIRNYSMGGPTSPTVTSTGSDSDQRCALP